jgi:lipopolysaccharide transport system permease protein
MADILGSLLDWVVERIPIRTDLGIAKTIRLLNPIALTRNLWFQRELILQLSKREIMGRYRGTYLGVLWSFLTPLLMLTVFTFVFGVIFKARWGLEEEGRLDFAFFLFSGLIVFNVLAECMNRAPVLILGQLQYVKKVRFPLEILPLTVLLSAAAHAVVSFIILILALFLFRGVLNWTILLAPLVLAPLLFLCLGIGWFLASIGVFFRDISHVISVATMATLFLSPIFYPLTMIPEWLRPFYRLNPLTLIIENTRAVLIWGQLPNWNHLMTGLVTTSLAALFGYAWFQRTRGGFADVL